MKELNEEDINERLNDDEDIMKELTEEEMKENVGGGGCVTLKKHYLRLVINKQYTFSGLIVGEYKGASKVGEVLNLNGDYMRIQKIKLIQGERLDIKNVSEGKNVAMNLPIQFCFQRGWMASNFGKGLISVYEIICNHGSQYFALNIRVFGSYYPGCI